MAIAIGGGERGRRRAVVQTEVPRPVVFQEKGAELGQDVEHGGASLRREDRPGGIGVGRLAIEEARAAAAEGFGQQGRAHATGVDRHGNRAQARRPGGGERADIGRAFHQNRIPRCRQGPERGRERGLCSRAHHHFVGPVAARGLGREPGPEIVHPLRRAAVPDPGAAQGAGDRGAEEAGRLQFVRQVAGIQGEGVRRGDRRQGGQGVGGNPARTEGDRLPSRVGGLRLGAHGSRGNESAAAGLGVDQAFPEEVAEGALHRQRPDGKAAHQVPHRRQPRPRGLIRDQPP